MKHKLDEKQITWGITAFAVIAAAVVLYFCIAKLDAVSSFGERLIDILMPFIFGLVFAYLLCPFYNMCVRGFLKFFKKKNGEITDAELLLKKERKQLSRAKLCSTIASMLLFITIITSFIMMIIPGLIDSLISVAKMIPGGIDSLKEFANSNTDQLPILKKYLASALDNLGENITEIIEKKIMPRYAEIVQNFSAGLSSAVTFLKNFVIGMIICVYFLNSKDIFSAQCKKLILAVFKPKRAKSILNGARYTNETFENFISGMLIDALIVGVITFIVFTLCGWHYALLISCIVGVTNIIPFFGPFLGAIPSALLLLIVDPMECLYFVIFIIILQLVEGNIIAPKILGDSTGLSSFWVLFAIILGGGLFGFVGMIIGIPVFAVIFFYFSKGVNSKLEKKGYSTDLNIYKVDVFTEEEAMKRKNRKKSKKSKEEKEDEE